MYPTGLVVTAGITILDEATARRLLGELLDEKLTPIIVAIEHTARPADAAGLLDRKQLAAFLQIDERSLRRLEREGAIPRPARIGGRIDRWRRSDIDRWLESGAPALPSRRRAGSVSATGDRRS
jgi:predicted DNA-binding transcriptional regulator AlpA